MILVKYFNMLKSLRSPSFTFYPSCTYITSCVDQVYPPVYASRVDSCQNFLLKKRDFRNNNESC